MALKKYGIIPSWLREKCSGTLRGCLWLQIEMRSRIVMLQDELEGVAQNTFMNASLGR